MAGRDGLTLRPAVAADAGAVAAFHVAQWRAAYGALAPAAACQALDTARRLPLWQRYLRPDAAGRTWLALEGDRLAGLVSSGPTDDPVFGGAGELRHLYVDQALQRQGLGQRLLTRGLDDLRAAGHVRAALAVVAQNTAARAFYLAMGGSECGGFTDKGPLWRSENVLVAWDLRPAP